MFKSLNPLSQGPGNATDCEFCEFVRKVRILGSENENGALDMSAVGLWVVWKSKERLLNQSYSYISCFLLCVFVLVESKVKYNLLPNLRGILIKCLWASWLINLISLIIFSTYCNKRKRKRIAFSSVKKTYLKTYEKLIVYLKADSFFLVILLFNISFFFSFC